MRASTIAFTLVALAVASTGCLAAVDEAGEESGRYTMSPSKDGVIRLDTKTGAMALCARKDKDQWACEDMADSQRRLMDEIERLQSENKSLKAQVDHLEETLGLGEGQADAAKPGTKLTLPTEQDVDKAFDYFERMLNKLHERMDKLEKKHGDGTAL